MKVPDVYPRAKRAPINKLLSDPVHAFRRKLVVGMLVFVLAIFLVGALGLSALWLSPSKVSNEEYGYLRVTVGDGDVYGFAITKGGVVRASIKEKSGGVAVCESLSGVVGELVEDAIAVVYEPNAADAVVVSAQFDSISTARNMSQIVGVVIESQGVHNVITRWCDNATRSSLIEYLAARIGDEELGTSWEAIVDAYIRIAASAA